MAEKTLSDDKKNEMKQAVNYLEMEMKIDANNDIFAKTAVVVNIDQN